MKPLKPQTPRPVALLVPGWKSLRIITADGDRDVRGANRCYAALKGLEGHTCYVASNLKRLLHTTGSRAWTADVWRGRAVTMHLYGAKTKVTSLRRTLNSMTDPRDQFAALSEVVAWLADQGVRASSVSSMAWALWRSTLDSPIEFGFDPKVGRSAFFGGRQGSSEPHSYTDYVGLDISKAYGFAMTSRPYAGKLREVGSHTRLDPEVAGFARASVVVPSMKFPPLPTRLSKEMIHFRTGSFEGTWTWSELVAARELGADVEVTRVWAPLDEIEPFATWWVLVTIAALTLSTAALMLLKNIINSLWGAFAMSDVDSATVQWVDDLGEHPVRVPRPSRRLPQANTVHIAAETTSRVRTRMLDLLYEDPLGYPVHVDTDGILVPRESMARRTLGLKLGDLRLKADMPVLEVRAPQLYRYKCAESTCGATHSEWHYVASGVPGKFAHELFDTLHPGFQISFSGVDNVVPNGPELTPEQQARYDLANNNLQRTIYGPTLVET